MARIQKERFKAVLLQGHKGAAVEVPFNPAQLWTIAARPLWHGRRGHPVKGKLNGVSFGSCIVPRSRKFWMLIDEEVQQKAGVFVGDTVRVCVEPLDDSKNF
jgi:Domain of unknown function (DUF1905)